jgi:hypothetical protein
MDGRRQLGRHEVGDDSCGLQMDWEREELGQRACRDWVNNEENKGNVLGRDKGFGPGQRFWAEINKRIG